MFAPNEFIFLTRKICDLTDRQAVMRWFGVNGWKISSIIHLAACVGGLFMNMRDNAGMFSQNIKINENILEACIKFNIERGIFCLSSCIYTTIPWKFPMDESMIHEAPPHPSNEGYAYAKRMLELQCRQLNKAHGTEYICVIPVNLYGEYDNFNVADGHVIPALMHRFYKTKVNYPKAKLTAYGTGSPFATILIR